MSKPNTIDGYNEQVTRDCERVLVTLLRNLGRWKNSIFLVGGLTPRYLVPDRPPVIPPHAGTLDLDIVIDVVILETTDAYKSLEENLRKIGFDNATNRSGQKQNWRWQITMAEGSHIILELLADLTDQVGPRVQPLPTDGNISALNMPYSSMVFDLHDTTEVSAELLSGDGTVTEIIRYANIVSFVCLKAFALDGRVERKDPHDLVYCIEHGPGGWEAAATAFREALPQRREDGSPPERRAHDGSELRVGRIRNPREQDFAATRRCSPHGAVPERTGGCSERAHPARRGRS
jgi:hypothetical protein